MIRCSDSIVQYLKRIVYTMLGNVIRCHILCHPRWWEPFAKRDHRFSYKYPNAAPLSSPSFIDLTWQPISFSLQERRRTSRTLPLMATNSSSIRSKFTAPSGSVPSSKWMQNQDDNGREAAVRNFSDRISEKFPCRTNVRLLSVSRKREAWKWWYFYTITRQNLAVEGEEGDWNQQNFADVYLNGP